MNRIGNIASILGLIFTVIKMITDDTYNSTNTVTIFLFSIVLVIFWIQNNSVKHYADAQKRLQDIHYEIIGEYEKFVLRREKT